MEKNFSPNPQTHRKFLALSVPFTSLSLRRGILGLGMVLVLLFWGGEAEAGQLADRLAQFPHWESKPPVTVAEGDLVYPDWMEGTWDVTSTLAGLRQISSPNKAQSRFVSEEYVPIVIQPLDKTERHRCAKRL